MRSWLLVALTGTAAAQPPPPVVKTSANDDLERQTARLAPLFRSAQTCIPKAKDVEVAVDIIDGKLVACAQVLTRQGGSVFLDLVSFGCWDVDLATGKLALRADKGRSYFACQDGCPGETGYRAGTISYDGTRIALQDDTSAKIYERAPDGTRGTLVSTISPLPADFDASGLDGIYLAGHFLVPGHVFDERGKAVATLPAGDIRVFDDTHAIVVVGKRASLFDLTTKTSRAVRLPEAYRTGPVGHAGKAYAVTGRTLVVLDGKLRRERTLKLASCTTTSGR